MNTTARDLSGMRFGRLLVISRAPNKKTALYWHCRCDCGQHTITNGNAMLRNLSKSCGCFRRECTKKFITHGMSHTREFKSWAGMFDRCRNPRSFQYPEYGGRGIKICERWNRFELFFADMGFRPKGTTLERIKNDGNYEPSNCKWGTPREQSNNTRRNRLLTISGRTQTISQWAREVGRYPSLIAARLKMGWGADKAVLTPPLQTWSRQPRA